MRNRLTIRELVGIWNTQLVTLGSVSVINTRNQPALYALYGKVIIARPMVTTPSDVPKAGQERDDKKASRTRPNYDLFFSKVETRSGTKILHEMRPGEMGSMIVSTPVLPRYKIVDLIRASPALRAGARVEPPYFRCIGRDK